MSLVRGGWCRQNEKMWVKERFCMTQGWERHHCRKELVYSIISRQFVNVGVSESPCVFLRLSPEQDKRNNDSLHFQCIKLPVWVRQNRAVQNSSVNDKPQRKFFPHASYCQDDTLCDELALFCNASRQQIKVPWISGEMSHSPTPADAGTLNIFARSDTICQETLVKHHLRLSPASISRI